MNAAAKIDLASIVQSAPGGFGAVIAHPDFDVLSADATFQAALIPLLAKHLVLRIDAPPCSAEAIGRLQGVLGVSSQNKGSRLPGLEHVIQFDNPAKAEADLRADADAAQIMHHDSIGLAEPPAYAIVNTRSHPSKPSTYQWIDMQAVYRDLPEAMKRRIDGLSVLHPSLPDLVSVRTHREVASMPAQARENGVTHPMVVRSPHSGTPALTLSVRRDVKIVGMDADESLKLMTELWDFAEASPHRWRSPMKGGEIFVWDNFATLHDRPSFSSAEPRKVWFANLAPQKPVAAFAA